MNPGGIWFLSKCISNINYILIIIIINDINTVFRLNAYTHTPSPHWSPSARGCQTKDNNIMLQNTVIITLHFICISAGEWNVFEGQLLAHNGAPSSITGHLKRGAGAWNSSGGLCSTTGNWMESKFGKPEILKRGTGNHWFNDWLHFVLWGNKSLNYCPFKTKAIYHLTLQQLFTSRLSSV